MGNGETHNSKILVKYGIFKSYNLHLGAISCPESHIQLLYCKVQEKVKNYLPAYIPMTLFFHPASGQSCKNYHRGKTNQTHIYK